MSHSFILSINSDQDEPHEQHLCHDAIKVSELINILKHDIEQKHRYVKVVGEISGFKAWRSGHCYFDIKDEDSTLPSIMFKIHKDKLSFAPKDGLAVLCYGRVSIYSAQAKLQLQVESMKPLGQGALHMLFEELKTRLKDEGLFLAQHKKPLPYFPDTVGIITSSEGAVLRDMVRILKTRMPLINILFTNVRVQGNKASKEIAEAISLLDQSEACDVIILGRGGGSLKDLWPFNEEVVARAIFNAHTPMISAVGHETDISISDFVADVRASTPTHAASIAVPDINEINKHIYKSLDHLYLQEKHYLKNALLCLSQEKRRLKDPEILLYQHGQKLDLLSMRLKDIKSNLINKYKNHIIMLKDKLYNLAPLKIMRLRKENLFTAKHKLQHLCPKLSYYQEDLQQKASHLHDHMSAILAKEKYELSLCLLKLEALSPSKVLLRGYTLVYNDHGDIINKSSDFALGQDIKIKTFDSVITAKVYHKDIINGNS